MNNNNLKYVREELEMTQEELGLVFGVKGSTVAGWENNNDSIPLNKLVKYANNYNYSLDYLTGLSRSNNYLGKFDKLDKIYLNHFEPDTKLRIKECMIESMNRLSDTTGDIYYDLEEILDALKVLFKIIIDSKSIKTYLEEL